MEESRAAVHHAYMAGNKVNPRFKARRSTFIRQWREHRGRTLEQTAAFVGEWTGDGFTHASLSRIERGLQPYSQPVLEALAAYLNTDEASLLMRDPEDPEGIWTVWDHAKPGQKAQIVEIAKTLIKTGT